LHFAACLHTHTTLHTRLPRCLPAAPHHHHAAAAAPRTASPYRGADGMSFSFIAAHKICYDRVDFALCARTAAALAALRLLSAFRTRSFLPAAPLPARHYCLLLHCITLPATTSFLYHRFSGPASHYPPTPPTPSPPWRSLCLLCPMIRWLKGGTLSPLCLFLRFLYDARLVWEEITLSSASLTFSLSLLSLSCIGDTLSALSLSLSPLASSAASLHAPACPLYTEPLPLPPAFLHYHLILLLLDLVDASHLCFFPVCVFQIAVTWCASCSCYLLPAAHFSPMPTPATYNCCYHHYCYFSDLVWECGGLSCWRKA